MDRYLMMLYVTLDQETALKHFFIEHGWAFSKPDLSITTDNVGPSIVPASNVEDTTERMAEFMSPAESLVALNQSVCSNLGRKRKKLTVARNSLLAKHPKSDLSELQSEETQCIDSSHSDVLTQSRSVNLTFPVTVRCENEQQVVIKLERADDELELTHQTHQNSGIDVTNNILDEIEGNSDNDNSENTSHDFYSNVDQPSADSGVETVIDTKEDILEPDMKRTGHCIMDADPGRTDTEAVQKDSVGNISNLLMEPLDGSFLNVSVEQEVDITGENSFECGVCDKVYKSKNSLKRHLKVHDEKYKFSCKKCTAFFENTEMLIEHKQKTHTKNYLCVQCGQQFFKKDHLDNHAKLKHAELTNSMSNTYVCPFVQCGKRFALSCRYQDHLNIHSGQKPHICSTCNRSFHNRYSRNKHESICSGRTNATCAVCNINFSDRAVLRRHTDASHKKLLHVCNNCGKTFCHESSLVRHKKMKHNGQ